jgi:hypothetical protein
MQCHHHGSGVARMTLFTNYVLLWCVAAHEDMFTHIGTEVLLINPLHVCAYELTAFQGMTSLLKDIYWSYNSLTIGGQLAPIDLLTLFSAAINFDTPPQWLQLAVILDTKPLNTPMVVKIL